MLAFRVAGQGKREVRGVRLGAVARQLGRGGGGGGQR